MKQLGRRLVLLTLVLVATSPALFAQTTIFTGGAGDGDFNNPSNWSNGLPNSTTTAQISTSSSITQASTTAAITQNLQITAGAVVNLSITPTASPSGLVILGNYPAIETHNLEVTGGATLNLTSGTMQFNQGYASIGDANGVGTFNLTNSATFNFDQVTGSGNATTFTVGDGGTGFMTQSGSSTIVTGEQFVTGYNGGTGTYNLTGTSVLQTGTNGDFNYFVVVGGDISSTVTGTVGTMNITSSGNTLNIGSNGELQVGTAVNNLITHVTPESVHSVGIVNQESAGSIVNIDGGAFIGVHTGATGTYNLSAGTINVNGVFLMGGQFTDDPLIGGNGTLNQSGGIINASGGAIVVGEGGTGTYNLSSGAVNLTGQGYISVGDTAFAGASGTLNQTGGAIAVGFDAAVLVGEGGVGTYNLSGGSLAFSGTLIVGDNTGSVGVFNQTGGTFAADANSIILIGADGTGTYNYNGGTFDFNDGMGIGNGGTFNQNAGTFNILASGQTIDIVGNGAYNLNSGATMNTGGNFITGTGNFNFNGGTLVVTGSTWDDTLNGSINHTSILDTTNGDANLSGNLRGTGTLVIQGGGTVTLSGINNANGTAWGAQINSSTLNVATASSLSVAGAFQIGSGSTMNILGNAQPTDVFAGSISGSGSLSYTGTGTLLLSGTTNLSEASTTTFGNGGSGTLEVANGTISNVDGSSADAANTFIVGGTEGGVLRLLGNNTLATVTVLTDSTLLAGNIAGSVTNYGAIGSLGTIATPSDLHITGSFTSTGTMLINTNGTTADRFVIDGAANVNGPVLVNGVGTTTNKTILTSSGLTTGPDLTTIVAGANVLFTGSVTVDPNNTDNLILNTVQHGTVDFAQTPNQRAVAGAIDPLLTSVNQNSSFVPVATALNNLTASQIPVALQQLSPESLQYMRNIAFENSTFLVQQLNGHLANVRNGFTGLDTSGVGVIMPGLDSNLGRSLGSLLAYNSPPFHPMTPGESDSYPTYDTTGTQATISDSPRSNLEVPSTPMRARSSSSSPSSPSSSSSDSGMFSSSTFRNPKFSEFISGNVILADLNQNATTPKASYTAANAAAGVSYRMSSNLAAGVLFDYNHTNAKTDNVGSKVKVDSYSPGLFATYFDKGFYANGLFSYGYNTYSNTRNISFMGVTATSSPTANQYVSNLDFGYDFHKGTAWTFGPTLGLTYTHLDISSFTETGAGPVNLSVNSQQADSLRSRFGGHVVYQTKVGAFVLQPNFTAMWQHEYLDNSSGITSAIPGSNPFTIETASPSRDSALLGCGLTASLDSWALYLNYLADVGANDYFAQSVEGGFKAQF